MDGWDTCRGFSLAEKETHDGNLTVRNAGMRDRSKMASSLRKSSASSSSSAIQFQRSWKGCLDHFDGWIAVGLVYHAVSLQRGISENALGLGIYAQVGQS